MDKHIYQLHAQVCKALAHGIRIEIIDLLQDKEMGFGKYLKKQGLQNQVYHNIFL